MFLHLIQTVIRHPTWHLRWLNTLSFLENCGARKLAAYEHPTLVKQEMLKHAAEEFRHAHYLKMQLSKLSSSPPLDYALPTLIGHFETLRYLDRLEVAICRCFPTKRYELVTYAIEKRAEIVYPLYQEELQRHDLPISVRSIIKEEAGHLAEIEELLPDSSAKERVVEIEQKLFEKWLEECLEECKSLNLVNAEALAFK